MLTKLTQIHKSTLYYLTAHSVFPISNVFNTPTALRNTSWKYCQLNSPSNCLLTCCANLGAAFGTQVLVVLEPFHHASTPKRLYHDVTTCFTRVHVSDHHKPCMHTPGGPSTCPENQPCSLQIKWRAWPVPMPVCHLPNLASQHIATHMQSSHTLPSMPQPNFIFPHELHVTLSGGPTLPCTQAAHPLLIILPMAQPTQGYHGSPLHMLLIVRTQLATCQTMTKGPSH